MAYGDGWLTIPEGLTWPTEPSSTMPMIITTTSATVDKVTISSMFPRVSVTMGGISYSKFEELEEEVTGPTWIFRSDG